MKLQIVQRIIVYIRMHATVRITSFLSSFGMRLNPLFLSIVRRYPDYPPPAKFARITAINAINIDTNAIREPNQNLNSNFVT